MLKYVEDLRGSSILVTGASGFIGGHLVKRLSKAGAEVVQTVGAKSDSMHDSCNKIQLDLFEKHRVEDFFLKFKPDYVIHLAYKKSGRLVNQEFRELYDQNIALSLNVIEASLANQNIKGFIFLGSCDEYGVVEKPFLELSQERPINSYGLSKLAVTKILQGLFQAQNFPATILRPSIVYGPGQGVDMFVPSIISCLLAQKEFPMTFGEQLRDFIYIDDLVDAIIYVMLTGARAYGSAINIGSGVSYLLKDVANLIAGMIGESASSLIQMGAMNYRINEAMEYSVNIDLAGKLLGWTPRVSLNSGLESTIDFYRHNLNSLSVA
jgi:nucleoside-diphosphate-sugar epimerase